jgi:ABC-type amino acid transport system permease subunit
LATGRPAAWCSLRRGGSDRRLPRRAASGAADLRPCRAPIRRLAASVCVAFFLNNSAYYGEIYRAGLGSVGAGQRDAARSTGLTAWLAMAFVVIPQAGRNVLPDLVTNTVEVVKLTSLASVVALPEMLYSADMARSLTYNSSPSCLRR